MEIERISIDEFNTKSHLLVGGRGKRSSLTASLLALPAGSAVKLRVPEGSNLAGFRSLATTTLRRNGRRFRTFFADGFLHVAIDEIVDPK